MKKCVVKTFVIEAEEEQIRVINGDSYMLICKMRIFLVFVLLLSFSSTILAKVSATVDRSVVEQGETFVLTVRSDDANPELDVLEQTFNMLGTSQSSKISFVNGKVDSAKEWIVNLSPKKNGISVIPSIVVGNERTKPIRIQVVKSTAVTADQGADIFLEVKLDTNTAYVQSEVIYVAKLFRAVEIRDGSLTEPEINAAVVERMGEDVTYQTTRNNRRYQVTERRFAVFPQKSGPLAIPPTVFEGQVFAPRQQQPGRANDPFDRFFQSQQRMKRVKVKSDAIALDVLPQPDGFSGENWLPAKRLILSESWSVEPPEFKVGEPITRTLTIQAVGQTGAQLPEFKEFPANGIKQYIDQPKVETGLSEGSLVGIREEKFAIIPTQSGRLILPEIRLYWWDTVLDKEQVVTIAPKVIDVAPGAANANGQSSASTPSAEVDSTGQSIENVDSGFNAEITEQAGYWPLVALALGLGWLLTAIAWVYHVKHRKPGAEDDNNYHNINELSLNAAKNQIKIACSNNDPDQAKQALLAWGNAAWPDNKARSLMSVGERLQDMTALQAVISLDEVLYSNVGSAWNGEKFWSDVGQKLKKPRNTGPVRLKSLPGLYPE